MRAGDHLMRVGLAAFALIAGSCSREPEAPAGARAKEQAPAPTNRVDVPTAVRSNLGVTFAKVE